MDATEQARVVGAKTNRQTEGRTDPEQKVNPICTTYTHTRNRDAGNAYTHIILPGVRRLKN